MDIIIIAFVGNLKKNENVISWECNLFIFNKLWMLVIWWKRNIYFNLYFSFSQFVNLSFDIKIYKYHINCVNKYIIKIWLKKKLLQDNI